MTGLEAEKILDSINITVNKNIIPFDTESPRITSGIRIGTPAMTTRGFKEEEFIKVANIIYEALNKKENLEELKDEVLKLTSALQKRGKYDNN